MKSISCSLLLAAILVASTSAQTFKILHTFGGPPDGVGPESLVRDGSGTLYGTTFVGGAFGNGTVFKVTPAGHEAVIYSFGPAPDGNLPHSALIGDAAHNLYGTTSAGGAFGKGTVFKLDAAGNESVLYSFAGGADGGSPMGDLVRDAAGNLYGTTSSGGTPCDCGTVFKLDPSGSETVLYQFTQVPDGSAPMGTLVGDSQGNLYGTTLYGGIPRSSPAICFGFGCGVVFKLNSNGDETVLYRFAARPGDGMLPGPNLLLDSSGNLYGVTFAGGSNRSGIVAYGMGTIFKLDPAGHETILYNFKGKFAGGDGNGPEAGLVRDAAGNFYGMTANGGAHQRGTVFKLDSSGVETILHTFTDGADGGSPTTSLVLDPAGNLYGTAPGGAGKSGVVFELTP